MQLAGQHRFLRLASIVAGAAAVTTAGFSLAGPASGHGAFSSVMSGADVQVNPPDPPRGPHQSNGHQGRGNQSPVAGDPTSSDPSPADTPSADASGTPVADAPLRTRLDVQMWDATFHPATQQMPPSRLGASPASTPLFITVSNHGTEPLTGISVSGTSTGPGRMSALNCDFWPVGGPSHATAWQGPLPAGSSVICTATVDGVTSQQFAETVTVHAAGATSGTDATATGYYHAIATRSPRR